LRLGHERRNCERGTVVWEERAGQVVMKEIGGPAPLVPGDRQGQPDTGRGPLCGHPGRDAGPSGGAIWGQVPGLARHAADLLDNGTDIATVAKVLGQASVQTTGRYDRRGSRAVAKALQSRHVPYRRRQTAE